MPIVVDLIEQSGEHAGIMSWQKIRMNLASDEGDLGLLHVFTHETVHAFELTESARKLHDNDRACKFFGEGLAEWLGYRLVENPRALEGSRRHAIAAHERRKLRFDELADERLLKEHQDPFLVYPVGELWVEALVRCYGPRAPGEVLRAMARTEAPRELAPLQFWQDTLQAAGYDLEMVTAAWHALLRDLAREHRAFLDTIPRLSGGLSGARATEVELRAHLDRPPPEGAKFYCRFRENVETPDHELQSVEGVCQEGDDGEWHVAFSFDRKRIQGRQFELQLGVVVPSVRLPICEPWQDAVIPR